jgi:hypothetical protein
MAATWSARELLHISSVSKRERVLTIIFGESHLAKSVTASCLQDAGVSMPTRLNLPQPAKRRKCFVQSVIVGFDSILKCYFFGYWFKGEGCG